MSDRVTNVEIEDVLSSIRRLVSEAATAPAPRPALAQVTVASPAPAGKLLLTEAHRINPAPEAEEAADAATFPAEPQPDPAASAVMPAGDAAANDLLSESGIVFDLPFAFRSQGQTPVEADYSTHIQSDTLLTEDDAVPAADADGAEPDRTAQRPADDLPDGIDWRSIDPGQRLADTAAGLEAATDSSITGDWEPDGSEDVPVMDWAAATEQAEEGPVPIFRSRKPPPLRLTPEDAVLPEHRIAPASGDTAAAPQGAAVLPFHADRGDPSEVDGDLSHDLRRLDPQDRAATDDDRDAAIMAALRDANGVNEALLRELVLEIVRQELQGALGERITRNVRKLVRREIYRVLNEAEQD